MGSAIVRDRMTMAELRSLAQAGFGSLVKAVVDVRRGVAALGGELHSDDEALLLADGSRQADLWGINLYPEKPRSDWLEYDSMINLRPSQGNRSRSVDDAAVRLRIEALVNRLVPES